MSTSKNNKREHNIGLVLILIVCVVCAFGGALKVTDIFEHRCVSGEVFHIKDKPFRCVEFHTGELDG